MKTFYTIFVLAVSLVVFLVYFPVKNLNSENKPLKKRVSFSKKEVQNLHSQNSLASFYLNQ